MELNDLTVTIVSVDTNPVLYNIDCSICDDLIAEDTENGDSLEPLVKAHIISHC